MHLHSTSKNFKVPFWCVVSVLFKNTVPFERNCQMFFSIIFQTLIETHDSSDYAKETFFFSIHFFNGDKWDEMKNLKILENLKVLI